MSTTLERAVEAFLRGGLEAAAPHAALLPLPPTTPLPEHYPHVCYCHDLVGALGPLVQRGALDAGDDGVRLFYAVVGGADQLRHTDAPDVIDHRTWPMAADAHIARQAVSRAPLDDELRALLGADDANQASRYVQGLFYGLMAAEQPSGEGREAMRAAFHMIAADPDDEAFDAGAARHIPRDGDHLVAAQHALYAAAQAPSGWLGYHIHRGIHSHVAESAASAIELALKSGWIETPELLELAIRYALELSSGPRER